MPLPTPESLALAFLARPRRACGRGYFHCSANTAARPPARGPRKQGEGGYPGDIHAKRAQRTDRQTDVREESNGAVLLFGRPCNVVTVAVTPACLEHAAKEKRRRIGGPLGDRSNQVPISGTERETNEPRR